MCERYALPDQVAAEREFVPAYAWWKFSKRFNVAAQQYVPAIRVHDSQTEAVMMRWGLIPSWAEGKLTAPPPLCVGVDELERSAEHRDAWLKGQRCILPIAGFYAWQMTRAKYRQPHFVRLSGRSVFGLAGIWDQSVDDSDDVIESCSIICVPANDLLREIGGADYPMPAILKRRDYEGWMRQTPLEAKAALQTYSSDRMEAYPVSPRVNSTVPDDAGLIRPTAG